jgi:hypothetical protein
MLIGRKIQRPTARREEEKVSFKYKWLKSVKGTAGARGRALVE